MDNKNKEPGLLECCIMSIVVMALVLALVSAKKVDETEARHIMVVVSSQKTVTGDMRLVATVSGNGNRKIHYQWRKNNSPIPGATGSTHVIQKNQEGGYDCLVK